MRESHDGNLHAAASALDGFQIQLQIVPKRGPDFFQQSRPLGEFPKRFKIRFPKRNTARPQKTVSSFTQQQEVPRSRATNENLTASLRAQAADMKSLRTASGQSGNRFFHEKLFFYGRGFFHRVKFPCFKNDTSEASKSMFQQLTMVSFWNKKKHPVNSNPADGLAENPDSSLLSQLARTPLNKTFQPARTLETLLGSRFTIKAPVARLPGATPTIPTGAPCDGKNELFGFLEPSRSRHKLFRGGVPPSLQFQSGKVFGSLNHLASSSSVIVGRSPTSAGPKY